LKSVKITSLQPGEEIGIGHEVLLGAEGNENKVGNVLNEQAADADPLEPARLCPTGQQRTDAQGQAEQLRVYPFVRFPYFNGSWLHHASA